MRHRVAHRKLGRTTPHRTALLRNLATALFERERIRTTLPKAKELRPFAEKLITLAKREDGRLHARRQAARHIQDPAIVKKLFDTIGARFATPSGRLHAHPAPRHPPRRRRRDGVPRAGRLRVQARAGKADKAASKDAGPKDEKKEAAPKAEAKKKPGAKKAARGEGRVVEDGADPTGGLEAARSRLRAAGSARSSVGGSARAGGGAAAGAARCGRSPARPVLLGPDDGRAPCPGRR